MVGLAGKAGGASLSEGGGGGGAARPKPLLTLRGVLLPLNGDAPRGPSVFALLKDLPNSFVPGRAGITGGLVGRSMSGLTSLTDIERPRGGGINGFGVNDASCTIFLPKPVGCACCAEGFAGIFGFSALFIGGGARLSGLGGSGGPGRLYSPDLLGGGGSGGRL